jgi:hypothetical protein
MTQPMTQPRRAAPVAIALLAALTVLLSACTAGQGPRPDPSPAPMPTPIAGITQFGPAGPPPVISPLPNAGNVGKGLRPHVTVPPAPEAGSGQVISQPLESYQAVTAQQQDSLSTATELITEQCMSAAGFSYPVTVEPADGVTTLQVVEHLDIGLTSLAQVRSSGFTPTGNVAKFLAARTRPAPGFAQEQRRYGTAWASALLGAVPGAPASAQHLGCRQAANLLLYGDPTGNPNSDGVTSVYFVANDWTQSDPRVLAAERAWSACIARHGLTASTPTDLEFRSWPAVPTPVEVADAVTDVRCKQQSNLANIYLTVQAAYQRAAIELNAPSLTELQSDFGVLQARARHLLELPAPVILQFSRRRPG